MWRCGLDTFRHASRAFVRDPVFALPAVISIALAVGANTAVFTIVNALWFRSLPVHDPEHLVVPYQPVAASQDGGQLDVVAGAFREGLERVPSFSGVTFELNPRGAMGDWRPLVRLGFNQPAVETRAVAHDYFEVLGVPITGRPFRADEDVPGSGDIVIVSDAFWRRVLGAEITAIGRTLSTTQGPIVVVGIAPKGFRGPRLGDDVDLWIPLGGLGKFSEVAAAPGTLRFMPLTMFARLAPGAPIEVAQEQVRKHVHTKITLLTLRDVAFALRATNDLGRQRSLLRMLWLVSGLTLMLGCANLAALMLARVERRRQELAIRLALGSSRSLLAALIVVEAAFVAGAGFGFGLLLRSWLLGTVSSLDLPSGLRLDSLNLGVDERVAAFGAIVTLFATAIAMLGTTRQAVRTDVSVLIAQRGLTRPTRALHLRQLLLGAHVALSMALLVAAVSLVTTVTRGLTGDLGFSRDQLLFVHVQPRLAQYIRLTGDDDHTRRWDDYVLLTARLKSLPGVVEVTHGSDLLSATRTPQPTLVVANGRSVRLPIEFLNAGPGWVSAVGAKLIAGRDLQAADNERAVHPLAAMRSKRRSSPVETTAGQTTPVAIIDSSLAAALWTGNSPLGQLLTTEHGFSRITYEVIGVFSPIRRRAATDHSSPTVVSYLPIGVDSGWSGFRVVVRSVVPPDQLVRPVRRVIADLFPDAAAVSVTTVAQAVRREMAREYMGATFFSWYGSASMVLGLVGVYGMISYAIARSRRERAIRAALGASSLSMMRLTVVPVFVPVICGVCVGIGLAAGAVRALQATVFGLDHVSPAAYATAAGMFLLLALIVSSGAALIGYRRPPLAIWRE